ncbi:MAG: DUF4251 domain-containing protein [Bacteroidetes bacterium]|nr:DUF4251 domain-containing protein [Bacteroidota bacterium]
MKSLSKFLAFILLVCGMSTVKAQNALDETRKANEVKNLVNSGRYTFSDERVRTKHDNGSVGYGTDLDISKDTLIAYLPDLGKEPGAPVTASASGITCIHFSYNMTPASDGGYDVSIVPDENYAKSVRNIKNISMHITKEGYANVKVTTSDHGPLQYHGYIMQHVALFPSTRRMASNE